MTSRFALDEEEEERMSGDLISGFWKLGPVFGFWSTSVVTVLSSHDLDLVVSLTTLGNFGGL